MSSFRAPLSTIVFTPGAYVDGHWVEGSETPGTIQASVQPTKPSDMQMLPEGRREVESFRVYSDTRLNTVLDREADGSKASPSMVIIDNERYEVFSSLRWQNNVINHFKMIVIKLAKK